MVGELDNPFSITKATEFSDVEINDYWLILITKDNVSINSILNPQVNPVTSPASGRLIPKHGRK